MQRCFLSKIDNTFNHNQDIAIGPWCFDNIKDFENVNFITPFDRENKVNFLNEHKKCFDMAHYLINKDMQHFNVHEKKVFFLQNQIRYLYLTYFLYSRYCLVKKFANIYSVNQICFEETKKPNELNDANFLLILSSATTGWIVYNIIKVLYPNHKYWFYSNYINNQHIKVEDKNDKQSNIIGSFKNYLYNIKFIINNKFNIFKEVKGISPYIGIFLSLIYIVRTIFKKSNNPVASLNYYEPSKQLNLHFEEFELIFNILKTYFVCDTSKNYKYIKPNNNVSVIAGPSAIIYNQFAHLGYINFFVNGGNIYCLQHGACYATIVNHFLREVEYNFSAFILWGTRYKSYIDNNDVNFILLPSPYLSMLSDSYCYKNQNIIIWITGVHYSIGDGLEYLYGTDIIQYIQNKLYFYSLLTVDIKQHIFYKTMPNDYDYQLQDLVLSEMPKEQIIRNGLAIDYMHQAKIVVLDYYGTPFYEAMSMNVPVVLCFLESVPFFDEVASSIFQEFKLLKIVHETPEELAKFLHDIYYTDINAWWNSEKIQNIRTKFLKLYANNENYFIPWLKAILQGKI